jgi:hypothetical protein
VLPLPPEGPAVGAPGEVSGSGVPGRKRLPGRLRRRLVGGAAAAALLAAGGVGGFAIGQAAMGNDTPAGTVDSTTPNDDGDDDGVPGDRPDFGGGRPPGLDGGGTRTSPDGGSGTTIPGVVGGGSSTSDGDSA